MPSVTSATIVQNTILTIRDLLITQLTDPVTSRATGERFVMTSYPERRVTYPVVTVQGRVNDSRRLGLQSEDTFYTLTVEVRVWAKNIAQKDSISQQVIDKLRDEQFTTSTGTIAQNLIGFKITSVVDVDEEGKAGIHSKIIEIQYNFVTS